MSASLRILLFGAIGRATAAELAARGHRVWCRLRSQAGFDGHSSPAKANPAVPDVELSVGPVTGPGWLAESVFAGDAFDVVVSCLASRSGIAATLGVIGKAIPPLAAKAELARIGHYYATESMLVLDAASGRYDADATPETGQDRLIDYYRRAAQGSETLERGDLSVFRE